MPESTAVSHDTHRLHVLFGAHLIADTAHAVVLREPGAAPVRYYPREDVAMDFLSPSGRREGGGAKGEATFYTVSRDGLVLEDVAWSYEAPGPDFLDIAGYVAFAPAAVEVRDLGPEPASPEGEAPTAPEPPHEREARADIARPYRDTGAL
jgi:uncharacterized protein (DUF427 family)